MNYLQTVIFSFSILIAGFIGMIRFKKSDPVYYPFIFCTWIACFNELLSYVLVQSGSTTTINNNIYALVEALLITWQFKRWDLFDRYSKLFYLTLVAIVITWLSVNLGVSGIHKVDFFFRVFDACLIVLMSIQIATWVMVNSTGILLKDPKFLICSGYIIFFTYKILTEAFWFIGTRFSNDFSIYVYMIFTWINLFVNLLFGIAVLCIPPKPRYISF